jgi:hypothetical protein
MFIRSMRPGAAFAVLLLLSVITACGGGLESLPDGVLEIATMSVSGHLEPGARLSVGLRYDTTKRSCISIPDAVVNQNGVPMEVREPGHYDSPTLRYEGGCQPPYFWGTLPPQTEEITTIVVKDGATELSAEFDHLTTQTTLRIIEPADGILRPGQLAKLAYFPPRDWGTISIYFGEWGTSGAFVVHSPELTIAEDTIHLPVPAHAYGTRELHFIGSGMVRCRAQGISGCSARIRNEGKIQATVQQP